VTSPSGALIARSLNSASGHLGDFTERALDRTLTELGDGLPSCDDDGDGEPNSL
jgi:hypothetical protein